MNRPTRCLFSLLLLVPAPAQTPGTPATTAEVALVRPSGTYADLPEMSPSLPALLAGGLDKPKAFYDLIGTLRDFAASKDLDTLVLDFSGDAKFNQAQIADLARALADVRAAGKKCVAYAEHANRGTMQLLAGCNEVLLADMGHVDLGSIALSVTYTKDAFDLIGIQYDVVRCGDFKGAAEPYMLSSMSSHLREHYRAMVNSMNDDVVRRIADGRKLTVEQVRALQSQRPLSASQAVEARLVDRLVPWKGARQAATVALGKDDLRFRDLLAADKKKKQLDFLGMMSSLMNPKKDAEIEDPSIVVLHLSGPIVDGARPAPGTIVSGPMVKTIRDLIGNDKALGVVVRINSPGGSATASEAILLALKDLAAKKPVVVSMGAVAGSGGYYVTCFGRPILAEVGTITGSIGVLGAKPNVDALFRRLGIREEVVAVDDAATMDAISRGWTAEEKDRMQRFVDDVYERFVGHVAASRRMTSQEVLKIAGGRVYSGQQAVTLKLVDRIGGLGDAIAMVAAEAKVKDYETVHVPRPRGIFDGVSQELADARLLLGERVPAAVLLRHPAIDTLLRLTLASLHEDQPLRVLAVMGEWITVR